MKILIAVMLGIIIGWTASVLSGMKLIYKDKEIIMYEIGNTKRTGVEKPTRNFNLSGIPSREITTNKPAPIKPWDHICPLCKQDGKKSILKNAETMVSYRGGIAEEPSRYSCTRGHRIVYVNTGTNWTVYARDWADSYWNEDGKLISPRRVSLTNEDAKVEKPVFIGWKRGEPSSRFISEEASKDLKRAYELGVKDERARCLHMLTNAENSVSLGCTNKLSGLRK